MVTIDQAIWKGRITLVFTPVAIIILTIAALVFLVLTLVSLKFGISILLLVSSGVAMVPGWLWWSWRVAKWKIWAFGSIDPAEVDLLKKRAIAGGLIWPEGSAMNKTEIWTQEDRLKMLEIAKRYPEGFRWQ
jgi:hypothetical protein